MRGIRSVLTRSVVIFLLSLGCGWADEGLVGPDLLNQAGLQAAWQIQLPLKGVEQVRLLDVFGDYLYVMTDENFFFCIDRKTGTARTLLQLAVPGLPVSVPLHLGTVSIFLVGQELKVFDPVSGRITRTVKLDQLGSSRGGVARNDNFFYVCGSDNRLHVFNLEGIQLFMATADDDSPLYSVLASEDMVWFGTGGTANSTSCVVAINPASPKKIWQYNLTGRMTVPIVKEGGFIYAAGLDTKLYKLDAATGVAVWGEPFLAGGPIEKPLTLGRTCIYVYTKSTGLHAVYKQTQKEAWPSLVDGLAVLAEKDDLAYIYLQPGLLRVMDNVAGKEVLTVNIAGVDRYAVNMKDSAIYLADKKGQVMAATPVAKD